MSKDPKVPRISFDSSKDSEQKPHKSAIKLDSSKSQFAQENSKKEDFEQRADQAMEISNDRKQRAVDLVKQFWNSAKDTTLESEKGPIQKSMEREIVGKLLSFASEMNNDPNESEGSGSVAVITLLLKIVLHLRDKNNDLMFTVHQLDKKVDKLSSVNGKLDVK